MATDNSAINALAGAVVTVVLSFIPFSPLLGGGVAGFLERRGGARIGLLSGVFASVPLFVLLVLVAGAVAVIPGFAHGVADSVIVVAILIVVFLLTYTVVLSLVGGVVGVYLGEEFDERQQRGADEPSSP
ncbi:MAG: DUF5518 domain-containing protein [Halolamina sp.]|jgi:hypothetical protein|uniref:DUF5518 domain-containing protein n=1 Tax=Halolamina sp. TaxID=1940283 RepID=UPI002FC39488